MTTAIVRKEVTPQIWEMIERIAPTMKDSRLFGMQTAHQAAAIMLKGHELGLGMAASFEFIQVIQDRPTLNPRGALALVMQSGECEAMKITNEADDKGNPTGCTVWMKRKNGLEHTERFTLADANRAGLVKPDSGWTKYPANMLRWRTIGFCIDVVFPDVTGGMKRSDEFDAAISPDGEVIATTWTVEEKKPEATKAVWQGHPSIQLKDLVEKYGATEVLAASNNTLPSTSEEVQALAAKLNGGA